MNGDGVCPKCKRLVAKCAEDAMDGYCPREWAYRDKDAEEDCVRHANKIVNSCYRCGKDSDSFFTCVRCNKKICEDCVGEDELILGTCLQCED